MKVATVQFQHRPNDPEYNFGIVQNFVSEAANSDCELIIFPECCLTGYWHLRNMDRSDLLELAKLIQTAGYVTKLTSISKDKNIVIGIGYVELDDTSGHLYNSYSVVSADGILATHRKLHCFISEHMQSGKDYTVFTLPNGRKCGVLICYDNNIVENVRATALCGAEILLAPHQTGGCNSGSPFAMGMIPTDLWNRRIESPGLIEKEFKGDKGRGWLMRWLPSRAHDNGLFVLFSNGVGIDDNEVRTGNAMILDPYGRIINETWLAQDTLVTGELDFSIQQQSTGARWLRARRPELYDPLTRPLAQTESTRDIRFEHLSDEMD
ncbi:MAG: acyltransferase [Planctomycetaceae bacterium]|nr:acyltransferase [Planctomycetaceae bacterium]